jgi:hypothetical protein
MMKLLPTPQSRDYKGITIAESKRERGKVTQFGMTLPDVMNRLLPTPKANDYRSGMQNRYNTRYIDQLNDTMAFHAGTTSQLNPPFVSEMMGFPVDWLTLPFQNGEMRA